MKNFTTLFLLFLWIQLGASIFITLEHATTPEQQTFGLMQRKELPDNHGMAFTYPHADYHSFWMFNTLIDLSLAFLDNNQVIREIHALKAYPEMMDPKRPIHTPQDFKKYSEKDPIILFFTKRSVHSSFPTKYALEMPANWFEKNHVQVGDQIVWDTRFPNGTCYQKKFLEIFLTNC